MLVPRGEYALHPVGVRRVPGDRPPVHVPYDDSPAGPDDPVKLGQSGFDVGHVLQDLHAQDGIEVGVGEGKRGDAALLESHVRAALGARRREAEHVRALVEPDHASRPRQRSPRARRRRTPGRSRRRGCARPAAPRGRHGRAVCGAVRPCRRRGPPGRVPSPRRTRCASCGRPYPAPRLRIPVPAHPSEEVSSPVAVDTSQVANIDVEPGELPATMAAWVIRQEREGEPTDAFQLEEIEVPEPGAFEVIVRVMAAGVNYNNVWAAMGKPVSVFRYHPNEDHHIGGSDASGVVWKVGAGVTRWSARRRGGHPLQPGVLRGPRGPRPRPARRALAADLGLRDLVGLLRPVHQGPGPAAAAQAGGAVLGGGRVLRPHVLHGLPHAAHAVRPPGRPPRADLGRRGRARRVRHAAVQAHGRGVGRRRLLTREGRAGRRARRDGLAGPLGVHRDDAQGRRVARRGEGALQGVAPLLQGRRGDPRRAARHRLRARRPGDVPDVASCA